MARGKGAPMSVTRPLTLNTAPDLFEDNETTSSLFARYASMSNNAMLQMFQESTLYKVIDSRVFCLNKSDDSAESNMKSLLQIESSIECT